MFKSKEQVLLSCFFYLVAVYITRGQGPTISPITTTGPGRPIPRPGLVLGPKESTEIYTIDNTKSVSETAVEVADFACGKSSLCDPTLAKYDGNSPCVSCDSSGCQCDDSCHLYEDCCADMVFKDSPRSWPMSSSDIKCERRLPKESARVRNRQERVRMVSQCPRGLGARSIVLKCEQADIEDIEQATPVSVPGSNSSITYRNKFCAQCFGVLDFVPWTYEVKCDVGSSAEKATSKGDLWRRVLNDTKCSINNSPPPHVSLRNCPRLDRIINKCNTTGKWRDFNNITQFICGKYYHPVSYANKLYKNVFCAICNGIVLDRKKFCFTPAKAAVRPIPRILPASLPLSVLIDFNTRQQSSPTPTSPADIPEKCAQDEIYDPFMRDCRQLRCPPRRIWTNGECEPIYSTVQGLGYSFSLAVIPDRLLNLSQTGDLTETFTEGLRDSLEPYQPFVFPKMLFRPFSKLVGQHWDSRFLTGIAVSGEIVSNSDENLRDLENSLKRILSFSLTVNLGGVNVTLETNAIHCSSTPDRLLEGQPETGSERIENARSGFSRYCNHNCFADVDFLPVSSILDCAYLEFNLSECNCTYDPDNVSLTLDNQTVYLNDSGHYFCGESLKLCSDVIENIYARLTMLNNSGTDTPVDPETKADVAMTIVSIVCIALSLICLLVTFTIYCILPQLRTMPGKNTMALIFHLFCAQLVFQTGIAATRHQILCQILGVAIHYFWLTTFAWMALSAFQMCTVFSNMTANRFYAKTGETKIIIRSVIICNIYAIIFIGSCIAYRLGTSDGRHIGYGGTICFLNEPAFIGVFFAVPLGLVLIFNTVCFIKTVMSIRGVPDMKNAKNKSNRNHMLVYFRLSILLGFAWIFGFIAAAIQAAPLWYVFIILNGLQGVFIFVAYCVNKRTWNMLKTRLGRKTEAKYSRPSRSSSSGQNTYSTTL